MTGRRIGTLCVILGSLCILAAGLLLGHNLREEHRAAAATQQLLPAVVQRIGQSPAPTVSLDGEEYLGVLSLPTLALELPVISQWSYPRLKTEPCRYCGSAYSNNLVIAAHNYPSHFGALKDLQTGDEVVLTDMDGNVFLYQVSLTEVLNPDDVDGMTDGWDLTLFTCTIGGQFRVAVRCTLKSA